MLSLGLLLVTLSVLDGVTSQDCTPSSIVTCLRAFDDSQIMKKTSAIDADLPSWNESLAELKDRCVRYKRYSSCISTVIPNCNTSISDYLVGLDDAYAFLCDPVNLPGFLDYESCYAEDSVVTGERFCNTTYETKLNSLQLIESKQDRVQQYCKYTDNYLQCLTDTVSSSCDDNSAAWQKIWNRKKRQQSLWNTLRCPNWNDDSNSSATIWTIVLAVVLGLTTLIMIVGILVILLFINRKKKSRRRSGIPPPPPYTSDPCMIYDGSQSTNPQEEATEPTVSLPAQQQSSASGEVPSGAVGVIMRPAARYHLVKPPPYMGQEAPAYETVDECSPGTTQGEMNPGFDEEEDVSDKEEGAHGVSNVERPSAPPVSAAAGVTDSERELNTDWF